METAHLNTLQSEYRAHLADMSENEYRKEMERLGIDLSWKSSQIEGNTYSLLETERLLRESRTTCMLLSRFSSTNMNLQ